MLRSGGNSEARMRHEEEEEEEEEEILGSDDDEQEDPKDYIKGKISIMYALIQIGFLNVLLKRGICRKAKGLF